MSGRRNYLRAANIARAFGLGKSLLQPGELVWLYHMDENQSYEAPDKLPRSVKFLPKWHGPMRVVGVGPLTLESGVKLADKTVRIIDGGGTEQTVSVHRLKRCYHPRDDPPEGMPGGLAEYYLSRRFVDTARTSILAEDTQAVENPEFVLKSIKGHRLVKLTGGQSTLEYCAEWCDGEVSWLAEGLFTDDQIMRYWTDVVDRGEPVANSRSILVKRRTAAVMRDEVVPTDEYQLPDGYAPVKQWTAGMEGKVLVGQRIVHSFSYMDRANKWYGGKVLKYRHRHRPSTFVEYYVQFDDKERHWLLLSKEAYKYTLVPESHTQWYLLEETSS
jgi:hypothetical protein